MAKTIKDHLVNALDELDSEELKRFRSKLCDREEGPRVRKGKLEKASHNTDLVDFLINLFTATKAVSVTLEVLNAIGCNEVAKDLRKNVEGNERRGNSAPQPSTETYSITQTKGPGGATDSVGATGSPPGGEDQPDAGLVLIHCSPTFKDAILREKAKEVYPIREKGVRKRLALLINNTEFDNKDMKRNGSHHDEVKMETLLRGLGYDVIKYSNLSGKEMDDAVKRFAERSEHAESDSTFVVIMSHGKRDKILGVHYNPDEKINPDVFPVDNIYTYLNTRNCPALLNKPKVILIQACRGGEHGAVYVTEGEPEPQKTFESDDWEHKEKDFVSLLSCTPDTVSYRSPEWGSLFITFLVEVVNANGYKDDIEELFRKVMVKFDSFKDRKQMVSKDRTSLLRRFYLFPGL